MKFNTRSRGDATVPSRLEKSLRVYLRQKSRESLEKFYEFFFFDRNHNMQEKRALEIFFFVASFNFFPWLDRDENPILI